MRLSSTIILITWCLTFIVIASIFVAKKVVMKNRIVIRYRNSYAINLVNNSEKPKLNFEYNMTFKYRHVYLNVVSSCKMVHVITGPRYLVKTRGQKLKICSLSVGKGQLISKGPFGVIVWTKKSTNF